ncbi:MAG: toxin-activating lysine-acyltransferase [Pelagimonas sp.]|jgi:cytolysin-activating lysine-acyltransferase|nr:toxin-activating lysine-acyltransferase [Pelagimonas sp.]
MSFDLKSLLAKSGLLHEMPEPKLAQLQGEAQGLFLASDRHRDTPLSEFAASVLPPIHLNQFRIYRKGNRPIGWVSWAYMSDEDAKGYMAGDFDFHVSCWTSGPHLWFIDYIAPFGHAMRMADDLKRNVFPDQVGFAPDLDDETGEKRIRKFYGARTATDTFSKDDAGFIASVT